MPEQSDWHTARVPMAISSVASLMAWLPLIEPFDPPTCMLRGWASGITPSEPGDSTTTPLMRSASARMDSANLRPPPPTLMTMRSCAPMRAAASTKTAGSAATTGGISTACGRAARLIVTFTGWVLIGMSR